VPSAVRDRARATLKHFPNDYEIDCLADSAPTILDKQLLRVFTNNTMAK
jgi:hypothetical protein